MLRAIRFPAPSLPPDGSVATTPAEWDVAGTGPAALENMICKLNPADPTAAPSAPSPAGAFSGAPTCFRSLGWSAAA